MIQPESISTGGEQGRSITAAASSDPPRIEVAAMLRRRWPIAALVTGACLVAAIVYVNFKPPEYVSRGRLYVEPKVPKIISDSEGVMTRSKNYLFTQVELFTSTPVLAIAAGSEAIRQLGTFSDREVSAADLKSMITARVSEKNDIIDVSCRTGSGTDAAAIVNGVMAAYVKYQARQKRSTAGEVLKILHAQKARKEAELTAKLQEMLAFKRASRTVSFDSDKCNIVLERLARLSDALTVSELETLDAQAALTGAQGLLIDDAAAASLGEGLEFRGLYVTLSEADKQMCADLGRLRSEWAAQRRQFTDDAPTVMSIRREIEDLQARSLHRGKAFLAAHLAAAGHQLKMARSKQRQLQTAFDAQRKLAQELNVKAAQYAMLATELRRMENHCDLLDSRIKEVNVSEDSGGLNISILEQGLPALQPASPRAEAAIPIALALGLVLGVAAALVRDLTDDRLRSAAQVSAALAAPMLGVVPKVNGKVLAANGDGAASPHTTFEACRTVRTAVFSQAARARPRSLLVTSPHRSAGTTTLVSCQAVAIAGPGRKTLLVDADLRNPSLHKRFELPNDVGLTDLLNGRTDVDSFLQHTDVENLDVLTSGQVTDDPSGILDDGRLAALLSKLAERYDCVLVDAPPVLARADAQILAASCDAVLLVLQANRSTRASAVQAADRLTSVGAEILGVVLNGASKADGWDGRWRQNGHSDKPPKSPAAA